MGPEEKAALVGSTALQQKASEGQNAHAALGGAPGRLALASSGATFPGCAAKDGGSFGNTVGAALPIGSSPWPGAGEHPCHLHLQKCRGHL